MQQAEARVEEARSALEWSKDSEVADILEVKRAELVEADRTCDRLMEGLAAALRRQSDLLVECRRMMSKKTLQRVGADLELGSDSAWKNRRVPPTRAARLHGLAGYLELRHFESHVCVPPSAGTYPEVLEAIGKLRHEVEQAEAA